MLRIFRLDGLMLTQEELIEEANRIIQEFQKYTKDFQVRGHTCTPKDTLDIGCTPVGAPWIPGKDCRFVLSRNLWKMCSIFGCNNGR